jgi:hypothetical protein
MEDHTENRQGVGQHEGHYATYFQIGHNVAEFLLDFGQFYTENGVVQWHTRIVSDHGVNPFKINGLIS